MLYTLQQAFESVRDFLELGGPVLVIISLLLLFMWLMILERMIYMRTKLNQQAQGLVARWEARACQACTPRTVLTRDAITITAAETPQGAGLRAIRRSNRSTAPEARAVIGSPASHRSRSAASASAV